ncbi:MAG: hypothetical protein IJI37_03855 [Opitutales bacterium]|nr:hypothetical protein [Opitutales bacterium]
MKKIISIISTAAIAASAFAEWSVEFAAGQFFNPDESPVVEARNFAVIADMNDNGFDNFIASVGDFFARGSFINGDEDFITLVTGFLSDPEEEGYYLAYSDSSWKFNNADYGFAGGEKTALIVWDSDSWTLSEGVHYALVTPTLAGGDLSGGDAWEIPAGDFGEWTWYFLTQSVEGTIDDSYGVLKHTVSPIPEPAFWSALLGGAALFLALRRRKNA